jgi:hypothetical protein
MITFTTAKSLANGAQYTLAQAASSFTYNLNNNMVSGTVQSFLDQEHLNAGAYISHYYITATLIPDSSGNITVAQIKTALETAAIAKYPDLQGGIQS